MNDQWTAEECGRECWCLELCDHGEAKAERLAEQRAEDRAELANRRAEW